MLCLGVGGSPWSFLPVLPGDTDRVAIRFDESLPGGRLRVRSKNQPPPFPPRVARVCRRSYDHPLTRNF